ncbi:MAG TPA: ComF family protein [Candidatus Paceibacterota bacterium]|nr:ComF family protein [Candidatus Paceibacterota bacterium]HPT18241.1 ComF family protein [Candidatus Paceibacterota bacterium]
MKILNNILDIIFPSYCISCGKKGTDLCIKCLNDSPEAERESAKWIIPMYDYRHIPVKKAVWLLKYKNKKGIASIFAEVMYGRILEEISDLSLLENFQKPILIPIPLSPKRLRQRGFNQASLICEKLIKLNNTDFILEKDVLLKPKDTEHQALIKERNKRLKNIIGSFSVKNAEKIKNRNIILIDDVTTTGATLGEAKKVLREAGAKKVIAFTVAH